MTIDGAVIREQGVIFAVAVVKPSVLGANSRVEQTRREFETSLFRGLPVVLMAQDSTGRPTYDGRRGLVDFLVSVPMGAIPWKRYTVRAG